MRERTAGRAATRGSWRPRLAVGLSVAALALLGAGCGDDDASGGDGPTGKPTAGRTVFEAHCGICHGPGGEGGEGPDLRADKYRDEQRVERQVVDGGGGMPAFGDQLSDREIADLVAFVTRDVARR